MSNSLDVDVYQTIAGLQNLVSRLRDESTLDKVGKALDCIREMSTPKDPKSGPCLETIILEPIGLSKPNDDIEELDLSFDSNEDDNDVPEPFPGVRDGMSSLDKVMSNVKEWMAAGEKGQDPMKDRYKVRPEWVVEPNIDDFFPSRPVNISAKLNGKKREDTPPKEEEKIDTKKLLVELELANLRLKNLAEESSSWMHLFMDNWRRMMTKTIMDTNAAISPREQKNNNLFDPVLLSELAKDDGNALTEEMQASMAEFYQTMVYKKHELREQSGELLAQNMILREMFTDLMPPQTIASDITSKNSDGEPEPIPIDPVTSNNSEHENGADETTAPSHANSASSL